MLQKEHFLVSIFCLLLVLLMTNQLLAQEVSLKPYGIESGIIEYKYSGSEVGKGIMYFDKFGSRTAMNVDTKRGEEVNKGWVISYKEYQYIFDPAKPNDGLKMKNPMIESLMKMDKQDYDKVAEDLYSQMGMKKSANEKFLDKDCIAYKGDMGKILTWNGILMLMDMNYGGMKSRQEVTSIKVNVPVDEKYFEIPKNIKFSELPGFGTGGYEEEEDSGDEDEE
ncbi:MAG: hypothetical protein MUE91_14160 [Ignavibacteriaceae bacterium]|nr:hypothetical protein [Ignavibacteriaceae bacterium]